ncbi:MAG: COX15/CtaA family protein [Spirochaetia bacterium]|nr:COX15/CtaA family protein [Spirochaetia bacterium]
MNSFQRKIVVTWLGIICMLIFSMVIVGGVTRLTHSGLSIVEWKPLMGIIPPTNEEAWNKTFDLYKQYPEYKITNRHMELSDFKFIFYWEYFHRLLGRLIGVVYLIPFLFFYFSKYFNNKLAFKLFAGFLLGGLQGLVGWFMVKSGLANDPSVSHYRLALHLSIAFGIAAYLFWNILDILSENKKSNAIHKRFKQSLLLTAGICLQIIYGAFTAGKKAGFGYNTFPKMDDAWIPEAVFSIQPSWLNFLETNAAIQFTHRMIAWSLIIGIPVFLWKIRNELNKLQKFSMNLLFAALCIQFTLGVVTILFIGSYEVVLPAIHQSGAFILFSTAIFFNHRLYKNQN